MEGNPSITIRARITQILLKDGKPADIKFALTLSGQETLNMIAWKENDLMVTITPVAEQLRLPDAPTAGSLLEGLAAGADPNGEAPRSIFNPEAGSWLLDGERFPVLVVDGVEGGVYRLTGREVRELTTTDEDVPLWMREFEGAVAELGSVYGEWRAVGESELVTITPYVEFQTGYRQPGVVDAAPVAGAEDVAEPPADEAAEEREPETVGAGAPSRRSRRGAFAVVPGE